MFFTSLLINTDKIIDMRGEHAEDKNHILAKKVKEVQMKALESGYSKPRVIWDEETFKILANMETAMGVGNVSHYFNYLSINPILKLRSQFTISC